jgi:uncharacterized protein YcbK (DUF882 family)
VVIALVALLALPVALPAPAVSADGDGVADARVGDGPDLVFDPVLARGEHVAPSAPRELSKKEEWFLDKRVRPDVRTSDAELERAVAADSKAGLARDKRAVALGQTPQRFAGERIMPVTTLYNILTHEALPILPGSTQMSLAERFHPFLRDHYTNQATHMDTRLIDVLTRVAGRFAALRIEVVSGYRSPKYNLMLRKKGHQVARHSQHMEGNAVDFRIRGVATRDILHYVKSMRLGGVGFYPHSQFVHTDTGPVRYWTGS